MSALLLVSEGGQGTAFQEALRALLNRYFAPDLVCRVSTVPAGSSRVEEAIQQRRMVIVDAKLMQHPQFDAVDVALRGTKLFFCDFEGEGGKGKGYTVDALARIVFNHIFAKEANTKAKGGTPSGVCITKSDGIS